MRVSTAAIGLGLVMLVPALSRQLNAWLAPLDQGSLKGTFLLGGLLGLIWSPAPALSRGLH